MIADTKGGEGILDAESIVSPASPRLSLLIPEHAAIFARLRIDPDLLDASGIHSVTDQQARDEGFMLSAPSDLSGFSIPYFDPDRRVRVTARLRRDHPDINAAGKPKRKYVCAYGDNRHVYFPPGVRALLADTSVPLIFVESEKSTLAVAALSTRSGRKILAIATGGCWGWRGKVGIGLTPSGDREEIRGPLPDLDRICYGERRICAICFDANCAMNPKVRNARRELALELDARGASVKIVNLPKLENVNGPDDLIAISGDEAFLALFDSAEPFAETAKRDAEDSIVALEVDKKRDPIPVLEDIAGISEPMRRTLYMGKVVAFKIPGMTKDIVKQTIDTIRSTAQAKRLHATESARVERLRRLGLDATKLVAELENYYSQRRHLPKEAAFIEALFAMNTYSFEVFDTTPYLLYDSATGGCGKTTALERHEHVCARAHLGLDPSAAALYRKIERDQPTWLLDEARVLQNRDERAHALLAIFDAGYKRGATVPRCEEHGESLRDFHVYCPKVLARIGSFRGTLLDRGIVIHLEKAHGLRQMRRNVLMREAVPLREKLEAYALQNRARLEDLYHSEPDDGYWSQISGREEEVWGPLLLQARVIGPEIEKRAITAALLYSGQKAQIAISEDRNLALAEEALEILRSLQDEVFQPNQLLGRLAEKEIWGENLANRKTDKSQVTAVGTFFRQFRLPSRKHIDSGTQYNTQEAIAALERHMPEAIEPLEEGVRVSAADTKGADSSDYGTDSAQGGASQRVSGAQAIEEQVDRVSTDTLTPKADDVAVIEEEL